MSSDYEELERRMAREGVRPALEWLAEQFRERKEFGRLFDARLVLARHELNLPLVFVGAADELPGPLRNQYEDRLVECCREVGELALESGDLATAYHFLRMIGRTEGIRARIAEYAPSGTDADDTVIELALARGIHPSRGIALIAGRYGLCQAITACEQVLHSEATSADKEEAITVVLRELHGELWRRLAGEIAEREGTAPTAKTIPELLTGREWLFDGDNYHIDTSHLNAVVRMARATSRPADLARALELCEYGSRLSEKYRFREMPPFDDVFGDSARFFRALLGTDVDNSIAHFVQKAAEADPEETGTYPHEVVVSLLARLGRTQDGIRYFAQHLLNSTERLSCPGINELCQQTGQFNEMAQLARERNDLVSFAAALAQQGRSPTN